MHTTPGDARSPATRALVERELALPDAEPEPLQLADLLHPDDRTWIFGFNQYLGAILDNAIRRPEPVRIPDLAVLRPLFTQCTRGHNGQHDDSPEWRLFWGTNGERMQARIRGLFQLVRARRYPREQYENLIHTLADHVVAMHQAAAEAQRARIAARADRLGAKARAQSAAALLEVLEPFQMHFLAWCEATRDAAGAPFAELGQALPHLRGRLERELS